MTTETQNVNTIHYGVSCDECGASPLRGSRYKSSRIVDYDICQECYEENHKHLTMAGAFIEYKEISYDADDEDHFENAEDLMMHQRGWYGLAAQLEEKPRLQNLDLTINWYHNYLDETDYERVANFISTSTTLKSFYFSFCFREEEGQAVENHKKTTIAILDAIAINKSVVTLSIGFNFALAQSVMDAVCGIIKNNTNIRFIFVQQRTREMRITARQQRQIHQARTEAEAVHLFEALQDTSIHSFVCEMGSYNLSGHCLEAAVRAMRENPSLKRIKAKFADNDEDLQRLMVEKKQNWIRDWNDLDATNGSRVKILEEIMSCKNVEEQDQIAALFHFVRSNPGALPESPQADAMAQSKKTRYN